MLRIAGQTAGLIGLKCFVDTQILFNIFFLFPRATSGPSVSVRINI